MKKQEHKKRNSLAVRLVDIDHSNFLETTGRNYSETLRELINTYSSLYKSSDSKLPVKKRISTVLQRLKVQT